MLPSNSLHTCLEDTSHTPNIVYGHAVSGLTEVQSKCRTRRSKCSESAVKVHQVETLRSSPSCSTSCLGRCCPLNVTRLGVWNVSAQFDVSAPTLSVSFFATFLSFQQGPSHNCMHHNPRLRGQPKIPQSWGAEQAPHSVCAPFPAWDAAAIHTYQSCRCSCGPYTCRVGVFRPPAVYLFQT